MASTGFEMGHHMHRGRGMSSGGGGELGTAAAFFLGSVAAA